MRPRLCLYVVGEPPAAVAARHGRFEDWFARLVAASGADVELEAVDGLVGHLPRPLEDYQGFVITGSPASLTQPEPWMEAGVELVRHAFASRTPLLGVCFGHQLIGAAFGGSVVNNPNGWEISSYEVDVTTAAQDDALFAGLPPRPSFLFSHRDVVDEGTLSPMNGVHVMAGNDTAAVQAIAAGPSVRGVQFHPEFTADIVRAYIDCRADDIAADATARDDAGGQPDRRRARAVDSAHGERLFANFVRHWVASP